MPNDSALRWKILYGTCNLAYSQTSYCGHSEIRTPLLIRTVSCDHIAICSGTSDSGASE